MKCLAIAILNWNGQKLLEQFLPSVIRHSSQLAQIYLIDNASTDDSVTFVKNTFPEIKIIQHQKNYGYAKGYNLAIQQIEEPYLCLLNSDVEVTAGWLDRIVHLFENQNDIAVIQPKILDYQNRDTFEYAGAAGGYIDKYAFPYCRGRIFNTLEKDKAQYAEQQVFWASGACFFVRKNIFEEFGGFDEDFFAHQEEVDLCWRLNNHNHKVYYTPHSTVYHLGGGTLKMQSAYKTFLNFRNSVWMFIKNHPRNNLFINLFIRLSLDGLAGIFFMIKFKPQHTFAILKAHFWIYVTWSKTWRKRSKTTSTDYYQIRSIVWKYYLQNRKKYSQLEEHKI
ncbi:MAG: glycosyltransferase family 2 protein [Bacteroidota bacterium]|nr:glycosyltransferase family 2 protein [Bacteroidota bacterium]